MKKRSSILERIVMPGQGDLSEELARYILSLDFPKADHARYQELSTKAQDGTLSGEEELELEEFLNVNDFLSVVQTKARTSLKNTDTSAA